MPFFFPRVQQLEEENTDLRTTVARLKSQTEKLDEVSSWSPQEAGCMSDGSQGWISVSGALKYFPAERRYRVMVPVILALRHGDKRVILCYIMNFEANLGYMRVLS